MRLPVMITVLSERVAPETTSMTDTCVIAIGSCPAGGRAQAGAARSAIAILARAIWPCALLARFASAVPLTVIADVEDGAAFHGAGAVEARVAARTWRCDKRAATRVPSSIIGSSIR